MLIASSERRFYWYRATKEKRVFQYCDTIWHVAVVMISWGIYVVDTTWFLYILIWFYAYFDNSEIQKYFISRNFSKENNQLYFVVSTTVLFLLQYPCAYQVGSQVHAPAFLKVNVFVWCLVRDFGIWAFYHTCRPANRRLKNIVLVLFNKCQNEASFLKSHRKVKNASSSILNWCMSNNRQRHAIDVNFFCYCISLRQDCLFSE